MILSETIEKVIETARVEEVVGDFVVLKKRGANYTGLCPFHNEKTPSFSVNVAKGIYKCFGCGAGGDSLKFIIEHEKLSFPDAIRFLAKKYNIEIQETAIGEQELVVQQEKESLWLVNAFARDWFKEQMWESETGRTIGLSYFRERGFSDETIRQFHLGYHPDGYDNFTTAATKAGYKIEFLVKVGLTIDKDGKYYDRFRGRVMFPIQNVAGKVVGFGGRIMTNDKKQAKYVNSPESEVYIKSNVLYGIELARKEAVGKDEIYLVEGYTDVVSLHQAGITNVVASSGTSLTDGQISVIRRYTSNVTVLYDGDAAGIKASFRGIDMIIEQGLNVKVLLFPDGEDPDSFARKNTPLYVSDYIKKEANSFIAFKAGLLMEETGDDPIKKAGVIKELVHSISLIPDNIMRSLYIKECSRITQMDEESLIIELNNQIRNKSKSKHSVAEMLREQNISVEKTLSETELEVNDDNLLALHEREIVRILVNFANLLFEMDHIDEQGEKQTVTIRVGDFVLHQLKDDDISFTQSAYQEIVVLYQNRGEQNFPALSELIHHQNQEIGQVSIDLSLQRHNLSEQWKDKYEILIRTEKDHLQKTVLSAVYNIKLRKVNALLHANNIKLQTANSDDEFHTILSEQIWLNEVKQALSKQLHFVIL